MLDRGPENQPGILSCVQLDRCFCFFEDDKLASVNWFGSEQLARMHRQPGYLVALCGSNRHVSPAFNITSR